MKLCVGVKRYTKERYAKEQYVQEQYAQEQYVQERYAQGQQGIPVQRNIRWLPGLQWPSGLACHGIRLIAASLVLLIIAVASNGLKPSFTAYAAYAPVTQHTYARVLQVIDGDALMIELSDTQKTALVRLACIATAGNDEAFTYITARLLGKDVLVVLDEYYDGTMIDSRWTPVYIYHNNILYNQSLLQRGYAKIDSAYDTFALYNALVSVERLARNRGIGVWEINPLYYSSTGQAYSYHLVNINTATQAQLQDAMPELDTATARAIVNHRIFGPYIDAEDCIFPGGLTEEEFDRYGYLLTVYTNINTATQEELYMTGLTASEARAVILSREEQAFTNIYQLNTRELISYDKYRDIEPFITIRD